MKYIYFSAGKKVFKEFLRSEYSEENMLFWLACEDLKKDSNPELVEEKARLIYEDYISILSPKEASILYIYFILPMYLIFLKKPITYNFDIYNSINSSFRFDIC